MRKLLLIALLITAVFGRDNVEIIPADVNYANEDVADFSESLYDIFQSAVAEYNYLQDSAETMLNVKENATPKLQYVNRIKRFHKETKEDFGAYMLRRDLRYLMVLDFSSTQVKKVTSRCQGRCPVTVQVKWYKNNALQTQKLQLTYNGRSCMLTQGSISQVNKAVQGFLGQ